MSERDINASIKAKLIANEPFQYAHLVKFERPFDAKDGKFRTNANRYAYYTDASHDIKFNDGNGEQTYRANRITSIGQYSETIVARATSMNLTLAAEDLGATVVVAGSISASGATFTPSSTILNGEPLDFVEKGFKEGDKVKLTTSGGVSKVHLITSFTSNNTVLGLAVTGTDTDDDALADSTSTFTITLESEELIAVLQDRGITTTSTAESNPNFLHRKVDVHKVFIDPDDGSLVGSASILVFRGIIASVNIKESPSGSQVQWQLTSHWGDFEGVQGRITTDEIHRALNPDGSPALKQAIRDEYSADLGFLHAETSLNTIATYKDFITKFRTENKRRGGAAGFFGGKYAVTTEYQEEIEREVDLNIHLGGKQLPIVYGVQRLGGTPIFADTLKNDSKVIYVAHAISEGEIHGIFNVYIDDVPLICTDTNDYDVRNTTNGADKDSTQLQCYGNMSWGATLNSEVVEIETAKADIAQQTGNLPAGLTGQSLNIWLQRNSRQGNSDNAVYTPTTRTDINGQVLSTGMANGMQHEESFSISHPYTMAWSFHSGRPNQLANNHLITIAEESGGGFKRQADYYTGGLPYWAEGHRLLDTAYIITRFEIEPDATEIPEVEYIVKGKVLECYNYDASYIPDAVLGGSDDAANFTEADLVTVQYSTDGTSWTDDTSGSHTNNTFKILDKYTFTTSRGTAHTRFILDRTPNLGIVNGTPTRTRLRLKSGTNYWHMVTWNHGQITSETTWPNDTWKTPTSWSTNGSGELTATVSGSDKTFLDVYGSESAFFQFRKTSWAEEVSGLQFAVLRGTWSGNTVTFPKTEFSGLTASDLTNTQIATSTIIPFAQVGTAITNAHQNDIKGCFLKNTTTGQEREIIDFNTSTNNITIESPFFTPSYDAHKFTITGRGRDSRASSNPAIQTLDYISSKRYGKSLTHDDLDLDSFISSAKLCDTRSDVTIKVADAAGVAVDDIFTLTHNGNSGGNHIASGKVLSVDTTNHTVTLTQVINKFLRKYASYSTYSAGDIVYTTGSKFYRVATGFSPATDTEPTHTSGTTANLEYVGDFSSGGNITIYKTAGNGTAASLNIKKTDNPIEHSLYDSDWVKYWRYYGWEHHHQRHVTRHQTNFIIDSG